MPAHISEYVPQSAPPAEGARAAGDGGVPSPLVVWCLLAAGAALFLGLILSAPWLAARSHYGLSATIYGAFRLLCHQMPERSFHIDGHPLAVCARCVGIYTGFAAGAFAYPLVRSLGRTDAPRRAWLLAASLPLAFDFTLGLLGIWANTHASRFITGALVGAAAVFYVLPGLVDLGRMWRRRSRRQGAVAITSAARGSLSEGL